MNTDKVVIYKPNDVVKYTPSYNYVLMDFEPMKSLYGQNGVIIGHKRDKWGWVLYQVKFSSGDILERVTNSELNQPTMDKIMADFDW